MGAFFYRHFPRLVFLWRRLRGANYEREMELLEVLCDPARAALDVGAKVGMYTYRIHACAAEVVAFEPIPLFHDMLRRVFAGKQVRIEPVAVSDRRGRAVLRMPFDAGGGRQFGRSTIEPENKLDHHLVARVEELEVETWPLDEVSLPDVGFIKIDVEGHELAVLEGAKRTLEKHRPNLLIECNAEHQPNAVTRLATWLDAHGYEGLFMHDRALLDIGAYDRAEHWVKHGIENFIGVHRSRPELRARLAARAATLRVTRRPDVSRPAVQTS
jgi:FkbM family methyltransferase